MKKLIKSMFILTAMLMIAPTAVSAEEENNEDEVIERRAYVYELEIGGMCKSLGGTTYYVDIGTIAMYGRLDGEVVLWAPDGTLNGNALYEIMYYDVYGDTYDSGSARDIHREYETGAACPLEF